MPGPKKLNLLQISIQDRRRLSVIIDKFNRLDLLKPRHENQRKSINGARTVMFHLIVVTAGVFHQWISSVGGVWITCDWGDRNILFIVLEIWIFLASPGSFLNINLLGRKNISTGVHGPFARTFLCPSQPNLKGQRLDLLRNTSAPNTGPIVNNHRARIKFALSWVKN